MKKQLFFIAAAALTLAACSIDETKNVNLGNGIGFRAAMGTRGTETTTANLSSFYVTAIDGSDVYFSDVNYTSSGTTFTSSPAYYWPVDGEEVLSFYAYSPSASDLGGTLSITGSAQTLTGFEPAAAVADQVDYVTAYNTGTGNANSDGVQLTFNHNLSQIIIKGVNNGAYVCNVKGVRVGKNIAKGDFNISSSAWTLGSTYAKYDITYDDAITLGSTAADLMGTEGGAMLIPQQLTAWDPDGDGTNTANGAYLSVYIDLNTSAGAQVYPTEDNAYAWVAIPIDTKWVAGYKYIYTLDFSDGAGYADPDTDPTDPDQPGTVDPGTEIIDSSNPIIFVNVVVSEWTDAEQAVTM